MSETDLLRQFLVRQLGPAAGDTLSTTDLWRLYLARGASQAVIPVMPGDDLQDAVDAAASGDVIQVAPQTIDSNILLPAGVGLTGSGLNTIIDANVILEPQAWIHNCLLKTGHQIFPITTSAQSCVATHTSPDDAFTLASHGLQVNQSVVFLQSAGNVTAYTEYWVVAVTTNTFQIGSTIGGTPIVLTNHTNLVARTYAPWTAAIRDSIVTNTVRSGVFDFILHRNITNEPFNIQYNANASSIGVPLYCTFSCGIFGGFQAANPSEQNSRFDCNANTTCTGTHPITSALVAYNATPSTNAAQVYWNGIRFAADFGIGAPPYVLVPMTDWRFLMVENDFMAPYSSPAVYFDDDGTYEWERMLIDDNTITRLGLTVQIEDVVQSGLLY